MQYFKSVIRSECVHLCPANPRPAKHRPGAGLPVCTMQGNPNTNTNTIPTSSLTECVPVPAIDMAAVGGGAAGGRSFLRLPQEGPQLPQSSFSS